MNRKEEQYYEYKWIYLSMMNRINKELSFILTRFCHQNDNLFDRFVQFDDCHFVMDPNARSSTSTRNDDSVYLFDRWRNVSKSFIYFYCIDYNYMTVIFARIASATSPRHDDINAACIWRRRSVFFRCARIARLVAKYKYDADVMRINATIAIAKLQLGSVLVCSAIMTRIRSSFVITSLSSIFRLLKWSLTRNVIIAMR